MKVQLLQEPELEFGSGRHIDIRFGLMNHGPLDAGKPGAPQQIRLGVVGTPETVEGVCDWFEKCRSEIPAKSSRQPNLFPRFPGFDSEVGFRSALVLKPEYQRTISTKVLDDLVKSGDHNTIVKGAADAFFDAFRNLIETDVVDVLLCAVPDQLVALLDPVAEHQRRPARAKQEVQLDFHDLLKARSMALGCPVQLILPATYDPAKRRKQKARPDQVRKLQDEATRAWNIHTALYYKAGGKPWRLIREASQLTTCYVGITFYLALDGSRLHTSMAQVFDERGDGIIVRGGPVRLSKDNRQAHLETEDARKLLAEALKQYREVHKNLPARVVVHKTSPFNKDEIEGFTLAAQNADINSSDFVTIGRSGVLPRLLRYGEYPPCRGTLLSLDERSHVLYTRGSVDFFATYAGMYVPRPLFFHCDDVEETPKRLAQEILALTKMNWNGTQFDGGLPITVDAARRVGAILKYVGENDTIARRYSHYM